MKVKVFDCSTGTVDVRTHDCATGYWRSHRISTKQVNLYTCLTHVCNADCRFCDYHYKDVEPFDFEKWKYCVDKLSEHLLIFKASFTGGEPTLQIDLLKKCCDYLKSKNPETFTIVNTNGSNLSKLAGIDSLDNIALSRHAADDKENAEIFKLSSVPTLKEISEFSDVDKIHISCNLIKGHVDSLDKVKDFLEVTSKYNLLDIGFVTLMPVNEYAKEHQKDFEELIPDIYRENDYVFGGDDDKRPFRYEDGIMVCTRVQKSIRGRQCMCKCRNFIYMSGDDKFSHVYNRFCVNNKFSIGQVVFMDNTLKRGFSGSIIFK